MYRRGKKAWITAALGLVLLLTASSGSATAMSWSNKTVAGWEGLWEWVLAWFGSGHPADRASFPSGTTHPREKSSAGIDPNGQPKSSSQIDPNGQPGSSPQSDYSSSIDPNGQP
jgi:hypothetical protein